MTKREPSDNRRPQYNDGLLPDQLQKVENQKNYYDSSLSNFNLVSEIKNSSD